MYATDTHEDNADVGVSFADWSGHTTLYLADAMTRYRLQSASVAGLHNYVITLFA